MADRHWVDKDAWLLCQPNYRFLVYKGGHQRVGQHLADKGAWLLCQPHLLVFLRKAGRQQVGHRWVDKVDHHWDGHC